MLRVKHVPGFVIAAVVLLMLVAIAAPVALQDSEAASGSDGEATSAAMRIARGRTTYRIYCQNCHGKTALGDGPIAELLKVRPTDLTRISQRNDGSFPFEEIYNVIDGRQQVKGHSGREMPIWGLSFKDPNRDSDQEGEVRERIVDLVLYVEAIQADESAE